MVERAERVAVRAPVHFTVVASWLTATGVGEDVSTTGIFVRTAEPRAVGTMLRLALLLDRGETIAMTGQVVRVGRGASGNDGMGVKFDAAKGEERTALERLVTRRLGALLSARCPSDLRLEMLMAGHGDPVVARHVASCPTCRARIERMHSLEREFHRDAYPATVDRVLDAVPRSLFSRLWWWLRSMWP